LLNVEASGSETFQVFWRKPENTLGASARRARIHSDGAKEDFIAHHNVVAPRALSSSLWPRPQSLDQQSGRSGQAREAR
jgi:hypothetical protein